MTIKKVIKFAAISTVGLALSSCALIEGLNQNQPKKPLVYLEKAPKFHVENFLKGPLTGFAIIQDNSGKIIDSYTLKVDGEWEAKRGTIKYKFKFNNGKVDARTWLVTAENDSYTVIGHDFLSPAEGRSAGNVSELIYTLSQDYQGKKEKIKFKDNLYLVDNNSAIIESAMVLNRKSIGKVTISLTKDKVQPKVNKTEVKNEDKDKQ